MDGISTTTQLIVLGATIAAFAAAFISARSAQRKSIAATIPLREDLLDVDLLDGAEVVEPQPRIVYTFENTLLIVLAAYAAFDRAFAWIHVPGTPLFVGEAVLALGILALMSTRFPMLPLFRSSPGLKVLTVWMGWGLVLMALQLPTYGLPAIRDSALWYYGAVAILVVFLLVSEPARFGRWTDLFRRAIPLLLLWSPIAMALQSMFGGRPPFVPDSTVSVFNHRLGNMGVLAAVILGFIWLVDRERGKYTPTQRVVYTVFASTLILLVGFQNRGGMVAATLGILLMLAFMRGRRAELVLAIGTVIVMLAGLAIVTDVRIQVSSGREISAAQMMDNIGSIVNPGSGESRQASTTQWRLELWTAVLDDVVTERPMTGFGPGPDLGERYGVGGPGTETLRNPHNSHLGVMARMGMIGFGLWIAMWITWATVLLLLRRRLLQHDRRVEAGIAAWLVVSAVVVLINAIFDPTLEGPQVGFMLWTLFGVGVSLPLVYSGAAGDQWVRARADDGPVEVSAGN